MGEFLDQVRMAEQRALLLDYDGTLAPFHVRRDQALPYPGVREIIGAMLRAGHTRLVVISGRWTQDLIPLLGLDQIPEIWGSHGWERLRPDGSYEPAELDERTLNALGQAYAWAGTQGLAERCERKPASLALHWRGLAPEAAADLREQALAAWSPFVQEAGLVVSPFDGGVELRVPGRDKGFAVRAILAELGADVVVAYLGDDLTDEDAFRAIKGVGLGGLVRAEFRPTAANIWLLPPEELLDFLRQWHYAALRR